MDDRTTPLARGSAALVWMLVARAFGLAAGISGALLLAAALLRVS